MVLAETIDGIEIMVDVEAVHVHVAKPFLDGMVTTLDYRCKNLRILSEHLRDAVSWQYVTEFLEAADPAKSIPDLWWRGQKGVSCPFSGV